MNDEAKYNSAMHPLLKPCFWTLLIVPALGGSACAQTHCIVEGRTGPSIQAAIDRCAAKGGGVAYLPPGQYVSGPLWLKDNVELYLEAGATIALSQNPADWKSNAPALVNSQAARNIAIRGRGTIDGKAQYEYAPMRGLDVEIKNEIENARAAGLEMKRYYRTGVQKFLIVLQDSQDIRLEGVSLVNSPIWTLRLQDCDRVWIHGVYVHSNLEKGVNADGIDIVSTSNVSISDSTIITGDDAICLKTDLQRTGEEYARAPRTPVKRTENVTVTNCILSSSSSAMVLGTETYADIRHVVFSNIVVRDSNRVLGINVQDGATVSDVRFQNITFELNRRHWNWWGDADLFKFVLKKRTPESRLGSIENITIDGVGGTARGTSLIAGNGEQPLREITLKGIRLKMLPENSADKRASDAMQFRNVRGLVLQDVSVTWDKTSPEPRWGSAIALQNIEGLVMEGVRATAGSSDPSVPAIRKEQVSELGR